MARQTEVEVKFKIEDLRSVSQRLAQAGFKQITKRTNEFNTLYDLPGQPLRNRGELLRLRRYGAEWLLTHKAKGKVGRHKSRVETETKVADGEKMETILLAVGFLPSFRYEKFRAEWADGKGHVVIDETPIGNFGEIEGPARWIDSTARKIGIASTDYITDAYTGLFFAWKARTKSPAAEMTFKALGKQAKGVSLPKRC